MKHSGVEWIGDIPDDWEVKTVKQLLCERTEKNTDLKTTTILSLSAKDGITLYSEHTHTGNRPREDLSDYKVVYPLDIVVNSMNILSGAVGLSAYTGCISGVYYVYYPRFNDNIEFLHYIFQCKQFQLSLRGLGNGILIKESENGNLNTIRMRIPAQKLATQLFPYCAIATQQKIAEYLDKKCGQVDGLIANQQAQIEKLKQYKQSVITEAVTRGLNSSDPLKDSGIDWIGFIPEHWEVEKLKHLTTVRREIAEYDPDIDNYIGLENVGGYSNELIETDSKYEKSLQSVCKKGDLIFSKLRPYLAKVLIVKENAFCSSEFIIFSSFSGYNKYLFYVILNSRFIENINSAIYGAKMPRANPQTVVNQYICFPPLEEQQQIADYLDNKCGEIDRLISLKQQKIEALLSYKKSLIYEYVTGKKEVV